MKGVGAVAFVVADPFFDGPRGIDSFPAADAEALDHRTVGQRHAAQGEATVPGAPAVLRVGVKIARMVEETIVQGGEEGQRPAGAAGCREGSATEGNGAAGPGVVARFAKGIAGDDRQTRRVADAPDRRGIDVVVPEELAVEWDGGCGERHDSPEPGVAKPFQPVRAPADAEGHPGQVCECPHGESVALEGGLRNLERGGKRLPIADCRLPIAD